MPTDQTLILQFFSNDYFLVILKGIILLILIFYAIFALTIVRQVDLMSKTLITGLSNFVKSLTYVHLIFALGLIVLAWVTL